MNELTAMDVARRLALAMAEKTPDLVAAHTLNPVAHLLEMVETRREFSVDVLWYLGVRKIYVGLDDDPDTTVPDGWAEAGSDLAHQFVATPNGFARSRCGMVVRDTGALKPARELVFHCRRCEAVIAATEPAA